MKKRNLNTKIAKYSLLAGAALVTLNACKKDKEENDPNIADTDINPDLSLTAPTNNSSSYELDVNGDGTNDLEFGTGSYTYAAYGVDYAYTYVNGLNGAKVVTSIQSVSVGSNTYNITVANALSEGNSISSASTIWDDYGTLGIKGTYYGNAISAGQFLAQDKYVGFQFSASGSTHYGWLRISVAADAKSFSLKEYAYHTTANTAIEAGAK
ncbi:MAG: hypothetical protein LRY27_00835 [Chitinophagales bacterium]|nr:hypothetical protein [Chitinophagales bacterium]